MPSKRPSRSRATKIERPAKPDAARSARVDDTLKRYAEAGYQKDKQRAVLEGIGTSEFLPLIEAIARDAGMTGLDYRQKEMLEEFLGVWTERDPNAALAWILGLKNSRDRQHFLGVAVAKISETDLEKAVELTSQYGRDEKGKWSVSHQLEKRIASQDADTMLRLSARFTTDGAQYGVEGQYPEGYDFRKALDGLAAFKSSLKKGETPCFTPSNLVEEWAKHDPAAAWQWLGEGKEVSFNDLDDFWKSYALVASTPEIASLLADAGSRYKNAEEHYRAAFMVFSQRKSPELVEQWLGQMPGERLDKLGRLLAASSSGMGGSYDDFKTGFLSQMTPEERTGVFESNFRNGCADRDRNFYQPLLRSLGHSDEQIDAMLPPKPGAK